MGYIVKLDNDSKTLYHLQAMNILTDGQPLDIFVASNHEPTEKEIYQYALENLRGDERLAREFMEEYEVYRVWAEDKDYEN